MHSNETVPVPPATGPNLLLQLGRLIIRSRSTSPSARTNAGQASSPRDRLHAKLLSAKPSTSRQVQSQPKSDPGEPNRIVEAQLSDHINALWNEHMPVCIEVLLAPECQDCYASMSRVDGESSFDKQHSHQRGLLLERWSMNALVTKPHESPAFITSQWLLNAVRSQLHFSQLSAWLATLKVDTTDNPGERRRKLSHEKCNYKKLESNCDEDADERKLNIVYSIKMPGETYKMAEFVKTPTDHTFPVTDIGNNVYLKVVLQSLPRFDEIPKLICTCDKRRPSKEVPKNLHEEIVSKINDLNIDNDYIYKVVDDRMHTNCSENGKHKCNCDEESDREKVGNQPKKLDERRLKEIAKYKRRWRKENKYKCDSSSSEESKSKETTSIPILQASRFDRFRAIGCYRNQTYLTLPASRIETKSPFSDTQSIIPQEIKKTNTVGTQTDDLACNCGNTVNLKCDDCNTKMVRSEGSYNLANLKRFKKHKCDIISLCDNSDSDIIKRPKLRRFYQNERIDKIINDRVKRDIEDLHIKNDDTVLLVPSRDMTSSINDDYVFYEKCDYGDFGKCDAPVKDDVGFDSKKDQIPSPSEMDKFRWRFDSAASMVFHTKTGLPLTSSPAPLRRGNNCFDFDDSINGISGIKSALFHPISPVSPAPPASPASPSPCPSPRPSVSPLPLPKRRPPSPKKEATTPKLRIGPSTGLLGSFEESALKGRLEPVATVHGFTAELGASGAFCPPHKRLPVTVFFYAPGGTNAPYMGHINLGPSGYRVAKSGTVQVSLFNPHGTLVKMFVVLYDLTAMPGGATTFLRQRTLYMPAGAASPRAAQLHKWLRYLIHLRFMTSKSGKLYLHTDIRIIVSRKSDLDTATAHSALFRPIRTNETPSTNHGADRTTNQNEEDKSTKQSSDSSTNRAPNRVFGGCGDYDEFQREICYENQNGVSYELRSFTYAPENPKYSPR